MTGAGREQVRVGGLGSAEAVAAISETAMVIRKMRRISLMLSNLLAPLLALILGQIAGQATIGFAGGQWLLGSGLGLFIALSAIGAHSGSKNGSEALNARKPRKRAA